MQKDFNEEAPPARDAAPLAAGQLLVADNHPFAAFAGVERAVLLILSHDDKFTLGVDLTAPGKSEIYKRFAAVNADIDILRRLPEEKRGVALGGPVGNGMFAPADLIFLHDAATGPAGIGTVENASFAAYAFSGRGDRFGAYLDPAHTPDSPRIFIGYTGWKPGQLANEIEGGLWKAIPATKELVFDTPLDKLWEVAAKQAGIDTQPAKASPPLPPPPLPPKR
jgi:putative transcriptional regulator